MTQEKFLRLTGIDIVGDLCGSGENYIRRHHGTLRQLYLKCNRPSWLVYALHLAIFPDAGEGCSRLLGLARKKTSLAHPIHFITDDRIDPGAAREIRRLYPWTTVKKLLEENRAKNRV